MPRHLTVEERGRIAQVRHQGARQKEIALALNHSPSTISRELRHNRTAGENNAAQSRRQIEHQRRSITFDNGTEFARCCRRDQHLGVALYSAEWGCSHQRDTNATPAKTLTA